jgi:hypothetical protein
MKFYWLIDFERDFIPEGAKYVKNLALGGDNKVISFTWNDGKMKLHVNVKVKIEDFIKSDNPFKKAKEIKTKSGLFDEIFNSKFGVKY